MIEISERGTRIFDVVSGIVTIYTDLNLSSLCPMVAVIGARKETYQGITLINIEKVEVTSNAEIVSQLRGCESLVGGEHFYTRLAEVFYQSLI